MQTLPPAAPGAPTAPGQGPDGTTKLPAGQGPATPSNPPNTAPTPESASSPNAAANPTPESDPQGTKMSEEAARWRTQFREAEKKSAELQAQLDKLNNAGKSDVERLTGELAKSQQDQASVLALAMQSQLMVAAQEAGLPAKATAMLILADPTLKGLITYTNGQVVGLAEALNAAKTAYPEVVKSTSAPAAPPAPGLPPTNPGGAGGRPLYTRAQLEALTTDQVNADWEHVQKSMVALSGAAPTGAVK